MTATDTAMNFSDFVFSATEIAAFDFNRQTKRIWAATNNRPDSPQTWQFRYDPLFIPEISTNNELLVKTEQWNGVWRTSLTILLDNSEARKVAYQVICNVYLENALKIQPSSVFAMQVRYVKINIPDLKEIAPSAIIIKKSFDFAQASREFTIKIESADRDTALKIENSLSSMSLEYEFSVSARKSQQNSIKLSLQKLKHSRLFTELKGLGDVAYVHRNDLRKLIEGIHTQVSFDAVIEKPEHFENGLFNKLLDQWNQSISSKEFDENKWRSTYNQDDLKPDIITKELNKVLTKDDTEKQWKINPSVELNTEADVVNQIKTKAGAKVSLSNDTLKKILREHSIEANVEGTKIEVKSIDLHQVNLADFNDDTELISVVTFVEPIEASLNSDSIEFSRLLSKPALEVKDKVVALFGKTSVGKSAIVNSLLGADVTEVGVEHDITSKPTYYEKAPWKIVSVPGTMGNQINEDIAIQEAKKAHGHIFVIDGEPYEDEIELFNLVHEKSPDTPKIVFVNKWDRIQNHIPNNEQEIIRSLIGKKMGIFVNSPKDIVYGSAMLYDREHDDMRRQELDQLINKMKEVF
ncbi:small GTP-binding protein [Tolypothrix sp. NIES-4075]|uniref:GTPase domain-containing protein n=1 Tax=Tolypothrix sp. NIES-4075 TaxID=2005459 RepID=UPI000B5C3502|nr:GTPase domain-containing protein [Tolypothrix sp. NIES-4075]GAX43618.1 small GTP-binding protein [Tolypothrix sp. NIES-4075]